MLNSRAFGPPHTPVTNCTLKPGTRLAFYYGLVEWLRLAGTLGGHQSDPCSSRAASQGCSKPHPFSAAVSRVMQPCWGPSPAFQPLALWKMVSSYPAAVQALLVPPAFLLGWVLLLWDTGQICLWCKAYGTVGLLLSSASFGVSCPQEGNSFWFRIAQAL